MLENIKVYVDLKEITIKKGISLLELSKMYDNMYLHKIIIAKVDGEYHELNDTINKTCHIEFFDLSDKFANRVYLKSYLVIKVI